VWFYCALIVAVVVVVVVDVVVVVVVVYISSNSKMESIRTSERRDQGQPRLAVKSCLHDINLEGIPWELCIHHRMASADVTSARVM